MKMVITGGIVLCEAREETFIEKLKDNLLSKKAFIFPIVCVLLYMVL